MYHAPQGPCSLAVDDPHLQDVSFPAFLQIFRHKVFNLLRPETVQVKSAINGQGDWFLFGVHCQGTGLNAKFPVLCPFNFLKDVRFSCLLRPMIHGCKCTVVQPAGFPFLGKRLGTLFGEGVDFTWPEFLIILRVSSKIKRIVTGIHFISRSKHER